MKYAEKLWNWFDGKKTAIGAVWTLATAYGIAKGWIGEAEQALFLGIGTIIIGGGLIHKAVKPKKK